MSNTPSEEYITYICSLYGDSYDDREEDSKPKGKDWTPGGSAAHKSLSAFQKELEGKRIKLSRTKLQKILISGGHWSTERSRAIGRMYKEARKEGMSPKAAMKKISVELRISTVAVNINLPYEKVVYKLAQKSRNAQRIEKCRGK